MIMQKREHLHDCPRCGGFMRLNETEIGGWDCRFCGSKISHEENIRLFEQFINQKEEATMQVTYNGFTGELVNLERTFVICIV